MGKLIEQLQPKRFHAWHIPVEFLVRVKWQLRIPWVFRWGCMTTQNHWSSRMDFQKKSDSFKSSCFPTNPNPLSWGSTLCVDMVTPAYHHLLGNALFLERMAMVPPFQSISSKVLSQVKIWTQLYADLCPSTKWPCKTGNASSAACKARSGLSRANKILKVAFSMTLKTTDTWDVFFCKTKWCNMKVSKKTLPLPPKKGAQVYSI